MKKALLKLTALMLFVVGFSKVNAQSNTINVVTTAVPFLRISPDARAGGMGDVGVATPNSGASAVFWNRAKLPFAEQNASVMVTYTPWLKDLGLNDVYLASLAGYYKLDEDQALSLGLRYFSLGSIQFTDGSGETTGLGNPKEFGLDVGYSRKLSPKSGIGIALRYINSALANGPVGTGSTVYKAGIAVSGDLQYYYNNLKENGEGLSLGVSLTNLGSKISYTTDATQKDYIPANLGLGVAYTKVYDASNKVTFAMDINKLLVPTPPTFSNDTSGTNEAAIEKYRSQGVVGSWFSSFGDAPGGFSEELKEFQISVGAEYWYNNQFALRAGYFYENPDKGNRQFFTAGVGLKYNTFGLDFSYLLPAGDGVTRNPLSNTLRFSMLFDINTDGSAADGTAKPE
ncbi:type IX secretion system outer membrane channel protein PorV [Ferruginibacter albus]|uniref:type IX secretion system outer membrane channel protein PorV n=1 Tax=Ferruginibacter albus TaxID=2875540 RepID=UPI001CC39C4A|nr:type IX secretion system outer membrane channel protein PorV [Ferruginibacter albus]UAY51416.1 type IX secretion system outer membrane channel protein PorV [Ferruginibacter albus]